MTPHTLTKESRFPVKTARRPSGRPAAAEWSGLGSPRSGREGPGATPHLGMVVKVKVCGIRRRDDAILAAELGASAVGFVFWPRSPRYITPDDAAAIARSLPADVAPVGVFVDPTVAEVRAVAERVGLAAIQLHGSEPATLCDGLPYRVLKAIGVDGDDTAARVRDVPADTTVLLDVHDPVRRGGTGRSVDWTVAAAVAATRRLFLAGGLCPANVAEAIRRVRPYGIDVSSGVEARPGEKDPAALRTFFDEVHHHS